MRSRTLLAGVSTLAAVLTRGVAVKQWRTDAWFSGSSCNTTPDILAIRLRDNCTDNACFSYSDSYYKSRTCDKSESTRFERVSEAFAGSNYVFMEIYSKQTSCDELSWVDAYPAWGKCADAQIANQSIVAKVNANGSATISYYHGTSCDGDPFGVEYADGGDLNSTECVKHSSTQAFKLFSSVTISNYLSGPGSSSDATDSTSSATGSESSSTSSDATGRSSSASGSESSDGSRVIAASGTSSSGISGGAIAGVIVAVIVVIAAVLAFLWYRRRQRARKDKELGSQAGAAAGDGFAACASPSNGWNTAGTTTGTANIYSQEGSAPRSMGGLWEDATIATARIPREKVLAQMLVSRGGFGEVYDGHFNGQRVAIKMLLPGFRKDVNHVNAFLAEVKLMAVLDHPRIVTFVGVAWDALTDLCIVSEFMDGGDLRTLMNEYANQNHPVGFDRTKVAIALHVAHALTYLHSLSPPVLHRDLKSRNVLLDSALEAKVTDFGTSRERVQQTMTAGVGTSLWMAPEVMLGEKYGDKADMFSFGVMLSELDTHTLPYAQAHTSDRRVPDTVILQRVATGSLRVEFSDDALESVVELGKACVSLDPKDRPTAPEAMYRLHTVLTREMQ